MVSPEAVISVDSKLVSGRSVHVSATSMLVLLFELNLYCATVFQSVE